mgnify:CR=1 FL=1
MDYVLFLLKWCFFLKFPENCFTFSRLLLNALMPVISRVQPKCFDLMMVVGKIPNLNQWLIGGCCHQMLLSFRPSRKAKSKWTVIVIIDASMSNSGRRGIKLQFLLFTCAVATSPSHFTLYVGSKFTPQHK